MGPEPGVIEAPAKINLFLEVRDLRPDGYHDVSLVNQEIGLVDRIRLAPSGSGEDVIEVAGPFASAAPADTGSNTVGRVLRRMREEWPGIPPLRIALEKQIPAGAGLGGGSSDASAVAMEVRRRYLSDAPVEAVIRVLGEVGSDMPFAAVGGTAAVEGRGERVTPVDFRLDSIRYILVSPRVEVSTAWAYGALDAVPDRPRRDPSDLLAAIAKGDYDRFAAGVWNAFETVVFTDHPELGDMIARVEEAGADAAWMTGSGSNLVGLCPGEERARSVLRALEDQLDCPVRIVRPYRRVCAGGSGLSEKR